MKLISKLRCCLLIFTLFVTVQLVFGENSGPKTCVPFEDPHYSGLAKNCVISKNEFILRGKAIKLPCVFGGTRSGFVEWFKNGKRIELDDRITHDDKGESLNIENVDVDDNGIYTCLVWNDRQSYQLYSVNLEVESPPYFTLTPETVNLVEGQPANLRCQASGVPKPTIKWMKYGQELNDKHYEILESGDLHIRGVWLEDAGEYTCVAANEYDSVEAAAHLLVKQFTKITNTIEDRELVVGDTAIFRCNAEVDATLRKRIDWLKNAEPIDVASEPYIILSPDSSIITIIKVRKSDEGTYTCVVSTELDEAKAQASLVVYDVPKLPTLLVVECGTKEARLSWNATSDDRWPITHYSIEYSTSFTPDIWEIAEDNITASNQSYDVKLSPWTNYTFRVFAWNQIGPSRPSSLSSVCATPPDVPYKNPEIVRLRTASYPSLHIRMEWNVMPHIEHNAPKFGYRLYYKRDVAGENWTVKDINEWYKHELRLDIESTFQKYKIKIVAFNEVGECRQPPLEIVDFFGKNVPSQAPGNFTVEKIFYGTRARLSWTQVPREKVRAQQQGYQIETWMEDNGEKSNERTFYVRFSDETSIVIDKLSPRSKTYARIKAFNENFHGPYSEVIVIETPDEETGPVTNFEVSAVGCTSMKLTWGKPATLKGSLTGYKITYQRASDPETEAMQKHIFIADSEATSVKLSDLSPLTNYRIFIRAITNAGEGKFTLQEKITRAPRRPDKPTFTLQKIPQKSELTDLKIVRDVKQEDLLENYFFVEYYNVQEGIRKKTRFETETNEIVIRSLKRGYNYIVYVIAVDEEYLVESDPQAITI